MRRNIIPEVIAQHAEEAALCWMWRSASANQPHYRIDDLQELDAQLAANLDGLQLAVEAGWKAFSSELTLLEPEECVVAVILALESHEESWIEHILSLAKSHRRFVYATASALGWLPLDEAETWIGAFLDSTCDRRQWLALDAAAFHQCDLDEKWIWACRSGSAAVRGRSIFALGELGRGDAAEIARELIEDEDMLCRRAAAWSHCRLTPVGSALKEEAVAELKDAISRAQPETDRSLHMLVRRVNPGTAFEWIHDWAAVPGRTRVAVVASGIVGDPSGIPWLIEQFDDPTLARIAGEAFTMITGLALDERPYEGEWPEGFEAGPNDDPADENVEMDPDENLPWPNRTAIANWWVKHRDEFKPGVRYLLGRPIDDEAWLEHVLRYGYQRQRAAAALELAIRRPTEPLFNVAAPAWRQKKLLGLK